MNEYKEYITREKEIIQNEFMYNTIKQIYLGKDINNNIDILFECFDYIKYLQTKEFIQYFENNKEELVKSQTAEYEDYLLKNGKNKQFLYLFFK